MLTTEETKRIAGEHALQFIEPGMTIGIGTGSTVYYFIQALAKKVKSGFDIKGVATSRQTETLAKQLGITMIDLNDAESLALTIDGADEIDVQLQLIKGGGGALLQEKMVAAASDNLIIIADSNKFVNCLGKHPLPVEVITYGWKQTQKHITRISDIKSLLRLKDDKPFISDHGHYILDCYFEKIENAEWLSEQLNNIPGVVENGLFINMASKAIIGYEDGSVQIKYPASW
ncbi:MAG: ribose-5-phosphate isomerase RpiA [Bacteroidota bacterium]